MATQLTLEERQAIIEKLIGEYVRRGWLVQAQSATRVVFYKKRERGCMGKILLGLWDLIFRRKAEIMIVEVDERGKIKETKSKANV
jgi:hypothetical protein